jgi:hypothetical protein
MATKKILLSNGNGKYQESGSITVDDSTGAVTVNSLNTTTMTLAALNGILSASSGVISSFTTTVTSGSVISSNGTSWGVVPSGTLYGDLSGTLTSPVVKSISNVTTGILGVARGGTGVASPTANRILFGNDTSAITTSSAPSNGDVVKIRLLDGGGGSFVLGSFPPNSASIYYQFYTASTTASLPDYINYVRFIIQAAGGGGGGGGGKAATNSAASGGGGGGGGGLTDVTLSAQYLKLYNNNIYITVGAGGSGALSRTAAANAAGLNGSAGGDSYVQIVDDNIVSYYFRATGGGAGLGASTSGGAGGVAGAGGKGLTASGGAGGTGGVQATANTNMSGSASILGAGGGGGGGGNTTTPARGPTGPGGDGGVCIGVTSTGAAGNAAGATSSTAGSSPTAQLRTYGLTTGTVSPAGITLTLNAGGGSGGTASTTTATNGGVGGNGSRGSGGGGGGASVGVVATPAPQNGGNGGNGYVLMIYW